MAIVMVLQNIDDRCCMHLCACGCVRTYLLQAQSNYGSDWQQQFSNKSTKQRQHFTTNKSFMCDFISNTYKWLLSKVKKWDIIDSDNKGLPAEICTYTHASI